MHRAGQCADELFAVNVSGIDLTPRQYEVLKAVSELTDPSQTTLVTATGIDRSTLADIVRRLTDRGLLHRHRTADDARKYAVRLTEQGRQTLANAAPPVESTNQRLLESLPIENRAAFLASLAKIISAIGEPKIAHDTTNGANNNEREPEAA